MPFQAHFMIQRVQTLYLLLATGMSALMLYLPVYELMPVDPSSSTTVTQFSIMSSSLLLILNGGIGVLSFLCIFLFKKRNIQIRLCNLLMLITCVLIGLLFFSADTMSTSMNQRVHYLFGTYLPLLQLLFIFLAMRYVKRDENLVRSASRLR